MGLINKMFSRSRDNSHSRIIHIGTDKKGNPVTWDVDKEQHGFFVGELSEAHKFAQGIQDFVEDHPLDWESISLYAPNNAMLKVNDSRTVEAVKNFKAFLTPIERDIYRRIKDREDPSLQKSKSLIVFIHNASMLTMTRSEWENTYPRTPYKATAFFQKKIQSLMEDTVEGEIHIFLLDNMFSDYQYLIENYAIDYGIETDDDGYIYKVSLE